jgi:glutathione synthase/RimK-type ligase-like ATP-grasp enzyme
MIVIIGSQDDHRCAAVINKLLARKKPFALFDTLAYPYHSQITFDIESPAGGFLKTANLEQKIALSDIRSVYYCNNNHFRTLDSDLPEVQQIVYSNIDSAAWSFFRTLDCLFVNPIEPANAHSYKGLLLHTFRHHGIRVPNTLITNDPEAIRDFYERNKRQVVCKPPWGQAFTTRLTEDHFQPESLAKLANSPVMLQEYITGQDYRAYVMKDLVFGVEIQSQTLDLNMDDDARRVGVELPESVAEECYKIAQVSGLIFTAIDMRRTPEGEYVYFEANSSPDFTTDEAWIGYPLADSLIDLLLAGR